MGENLKHTQVTPWPSGQAVPVCNRTAAVLREAAHKWSPANHQLHADQLRKAVHTVMLLDVRGVLPLPTDIWLNLVFPSLHRSGW